MICPSPFEFRVAMDERGYKVFRREGQPFNLNIVGWRGRRQKPNEFNDILAVYWEDKIGFKYEYWPITTVPGVPWLLNPINKLGTAILVSGQYLSAYELGVYKGYEALKQIGPVEVFRDPNRDGIVNTREVLKQKGVFGIHIHRAGIWSKLVGVSSAGCQVFQKRVDFDDFINLCNTASTIWGNKFTYTLVEI